MDPPSAAGPGGSSSADLAVLNSLNPQQLTEIVQLVLKFLVSPKAAEFQGELGAFAQAHGVNVTAMKSIVRSLLLFLQEAMKSNWPLSHLKEQCLEAGLNEVSAEVVTTVWGTNYGSISSSLVGRTLAANQLVDMEWKFGVTASSDDSLQIGATFLQMKLVIDRGSGKHEQCFMEVSLEQFYNLMAQMERARAYINYISNDG